MSVNNTITTNKPLKKFVERNIKVDVKKGSIMSIMRYCCHHIVSKKSFLVFALFIPIDSRNGTYF